MNQMVAMLFGLIAIGDFVLFTHLRDRRIQTAKYERMRNGLRIALLHGQSGATELTN
jgi:hypothetical protein